MIDKAINVFSRFVSIVLLSIATIYSAFQLLAIIGETVQAIVKYIPSQGRAYFPEYILKIVTLIFSIILLVALMRTIKVFGRHYGFKMRATIIVCLVGVARRMSMMQYNNETYREEVAIVALVFALTAAFFLMQQKKPELWFGNLFRKWRLDK